tara:strand:+ start:54 stop:785 length:732 start_codon:yes stop_codon:yes gene_type:complete
MAITISGTDGIVGAGFTVDASGVSVTAGVGTFASIGAGVSIPVDGFTGTISEGRLPNFNANKITSGTIADARFPATLPAISGANLTGITAGITEADQWRVNTSFNVNGSSFITSNWERVDITGYDKLGTGMSESSGVFTFPSTGIWNVIFWTTVRPTDNTTMYAGVEYYYTTDNSSYSNVANFYGGVSTTAFFDCISASHIFDISNVSTHKIKFRATSASTCGYSGNTSETQLAATFIRLGDT